MHVELKEALADYLLSMADDELILGHRNSQWTTHAPILEEDIAFTNIALDEISHATIWYSLLADVTENDREIYPDQLVFFRNASEYRNIQLVEFPIGDWAFSMLRQYFFDVAEMVRLQQLSYSTYQPLAQAAAKIRQEEIYHYRHTYAWIKRLALGSQESNMRLQNALEKLWPYTLQIFYISEELPLIEAGYIPDSKGLFCAWKKLVVPFIKKIKLTIPNNFSPVVATREEHTKYLPPLLEEMQQVARLEPQASW